jgi:hypothetical protein
MTTPPCLLFPLLRLICHPRKKLFEFVEITSLLFVCLSFFANFCTALCLVRTTLVGALTAMQVFGWVAMAVGVTSVFMAMLVLVAVIINCYIDVQPLNNRHVVSLLHV